MTNDEELWEDTTTVKVDSKPTNSINKNNFVFEEAENNAKSVWAFYANKGEGKTGSAFGLPGSKTAISFDNKTKLIHKYMYNDSTEIKVYNALKYYSKTPETYLDSAETTYEYIMFLLDNINKDKPDWIVIDGTEVLEEICEMYMRKRNNVKPYGGISNLNIWKERRQLMDSVFRKSLLSCNKGVVFTLYCKKDELYEDGQLIKSKDIPKWADSILREVDIVIRIESKLEKGVHQVIAKVESSKIPVLLKTGQIINLTGKKISDFMGEKK